MIFMSKMAVCKHLTATILVHYSFTIATSIMKKYLHFSQYVLKKYTFNISLRIRHSNNMPSK